MKNEKGYKPDWTTCNGEDLPPKEEIEITEELEEIWL